MWPRRQRRRPEKMGGGMDAEFSADKPLLKRNQPEPAPTDDGRLQLGGKTKGRGRRESEHQEARWPV